MTIADAHPFVQWVEDHWKFVSIGGIASLMGIYTAVRAYFDSQADRKIRTALRECGPMSSAELQGRTNLRVATIDRRLLELCDKGITETAVKPHPTTGEVRRIWWLKFPTRT